MVLENVQIKLIGEEKTGVSQTTGKAWSCMDIVLGWQEADGGEGYLKVTTSGDIWREAGCPEVGDVVTVDLLFRTALYGQGRVINDVRLRSVGLADARSEE